MAQTAPLTRFVEQVGNTLSRAFKNTEDRQSVVRQYA